MPSVDSNLDASDSFALFGLERRFDNDLVDLDARYAGLASRIDSTAAGEASSTAQAHEKLAAARQTLADPVARGVHLLSLIGGAGEPETDALPPDLRDRMDALRASPSPDAVGQMREDVMARLSNLFRLMGSADNGVVLRGRRVQIRQTLNTLRAVDGLGGTPVR